MRITSSGAWWVRPDGAASKALPADNEDSSQVLVTEVEFDLLKGPLDQERRVGMDDWPYAFHCETGGKSDKQLLTNSNVHHPSGMSLHRAALFEI
jgi:hypothetical protein